MRVFCFAEGLYDGKTGGGGKGVTYRLYEANRKYRLIGNMFCVFGNAVLSCDDGPVDLSDDEEIIKGGISGLMRYYRSLKEILHFTSEDVYIFHDLSCFYAMKHVADYIDNTACVYHGQGSLYHEAVSFGLDPDDEYKSKAEQLTRYALSCSQIVCFPSEGARQAFIETSEKDVCDSLENSICRICYNGCIPETARDISQYEELFDAIERKKRSGRIFVTVAALNKAKGVDRLPGFFEDYGKEHDYLWILIGNGVLNDLVERKLQGIRDNVLWIKDPLPNDIIISIYERADYYILAHRISIFDFATIEAMHMGVIPILTPVGGNREMICEDNGFFLNEEKPGDSRAFAAWEEDKDISELKKKNSELAYKLFSDEQMLRNYRELAKELSQDHEKKDFLIIVPDLELNGAQVVLKELLELPCFEDKTIDIISPTKGVYGNIYRNKGYNVRIRPYIKGDEAFRRRLQSGYRRVLINTSSCNQYLMYFQNTQVPVFFWLHETFDQLVSTNAEFLNPALYSSNIRVLGVTKKVAEGIHRKYGDVKVELLPMPVADKSGTADFDIERIDRTLLDKLEGKILFFLPAAYTLIKGQDILLQAVLGLPEEYREKAHFLLCGYRLPGQREYYDSLKRICEKLPDVTMLDEVPRDEVYFWYSVADCVLAPSRVDATPTSIIEAMMYHRITIVSDATGISQYLEDCISSFVFPSENAEELRKRIMLLIHDYGEFEAVGERAAKIYKDNFSPEYVDGLLQKYFEDNREKS